MLTVTNPDPERCPAAVYERDTYRYTGRVKGGFERHYRRRQCERKRGPGEQGLCWQHAREAMA